MTGPGTVQASVHAGLRPALWSRVILAAVTAAGIPRSSRPGRCRHPCADVPAAA